MFSGWGWNGLGVALHDILPIIQIAEFTGVAGLSFLVAFANVIAVATVRRFILETQVRIRRPHYDFTLTMAAIVGLCGLRNSALANAQPRPKPLRVAAGPGQRAAGAKNSAASFQEKTFEQFDSPDRTSRSRPGRRRN